MKFAIVGMSGRYPKAETLATLWENLKTGVDGVGEVTGERWDVGYHSKDSDQPNRVYTRSGGFIANFDRFDADFFGMSPREAKQVDPQHRLLLELSWEAMESAGIVPSDLSGTRTGVFVGISANDYATLASDEGVDAYTNIGSALSIAANRISYVFDLHGPSMSIDTACSSSLVAMHQACMSIATGGCSVALVGGMNMLLSVRPWLGFAQASMLSPDGRCKSFDASGNGYVRSEGGGVVIVKPLEDAERDGNEILAVILGTGVNSDGRTMGMAMPSGEAQEALLREVYGRCGIEAEQVFYVEAHGTGTAVGDPIECGAIGRVLGSPRTDGSTCRIGSIKSNIGHLESGAGIAGLTKVLLALQHGEIPANLHFNEPNPKIDFDAWRLSVVTEPLALPQTTSPLVFGINSFGFGGTNAHVVLQQYRPAAQAKPAPIPLADADLLFLSAHSAEALDSVATLYADYLRGSPADAWPAIRATAALARARHPFRLVVAGASASEVADRLDRVVAGDKGPLFARGRAGTRKSRLAFAFSGNGPQWSGMGRELLAQNQVFRDEVAAIDTLFAPLAGWSLIHAMTRPESEVEISLTEIAQPMLFALQAGLVAVLRAGGIVPDAVFGHSVGEVAAAYASGALSRAQAVRVVVHRSQLQALTAGKGRMAAVSIDAADAARRIEAAGGWLEIAAINAPKAVTIAGDPDALEALVDDVVEDGHFARVLTIDYPFHTAAMDEIRLPLLERLAGLAPSAAAVPFISTVEGATLDGAALDASYWWRNVRSPVAFAAGVAAALADHAVDVIVEIGPHPVLTDYVQQIIKATDGSTATALGTLRRPSRTLAAPEVQTFTTAICAMHAAGVGQLDQLFVKPERWATLPAYPWARTVAWRGGCELPETVYPLVREHDLLGHRVASGDGLWTNTIQFPLLPYLADHVIKGVPLFPAAGYIELAMAAGGLVLGAGPLDVENFTILRPLAMPPGSEPLLQTAIDGADGTLMIRSRPDIRTADWVDHAKCRVTRVEGADIDATIDLAALRAGMPVRITREQHYAGCLRRGLAYGPSFQGIVSIALTASAATHRAALADIDLSAYGDGMDGYRIHPSIFDNCLQTLITLIEQNDQRDCATIPVQLGRVRSFGTVPARVFCHITLRTESVRSGMADMVITDADGRIVMTMDEGRFQKVEFRSTALPTLAEDWRPDPAWTSRTIAAAALPSPEVILGAMAPALATMAAGEPAREAVRRSLEALAAEPSDASWRQSMLDHPDHAAELMALARVGATGATPTPAMLDTLEDTAPFRAPFNQLAAETLAAILARSPTHRPVRIIELDGSTGGLTARLLPLLPPERSDYVFAAAGEERVGRAGHRFGQWHFFRTIDTAAAEIAESGFDIAIVHGVADPALLSRLLVPGGLVLVLSPPRSRLATLLLGTPASAPDLAESGFTIVPIWPASETGHALSVAQRQGEAHATRPAARVESAKRRVLLTGTAEAGNSFIARLAAALTEAGDTVTTRVVGAADLSDAAFVTLLDADPDADEFVHLIGWSGDALTGGDILAMQDLRCLSTAMLARAIEARSAADERASYAPVLTLVTRAGLAGPDGMGPGDPFQATLAGLGRVMANEQASLDCRLIDIHAVSDLNAADDLAAAILARDEETEVLLWEGRRYLNRVRLSSPAEQARISRSLPAIGPRSARPYRLDFVPQGGLDSLHLREMVRREPGAGEIEIEVRAAGLNFRDVLWTMGMLPEDAVEHGFSGPTIGMECSGVVVRVGQGADGFRVGDAVIAFASSCFASHVTTAASCAIVMPAGLSFAAAATVPTAFVTAWYALTYLARLEPGESVLIHGAAGGVGLAALQIAKLRGAVVFASAGSADKQRLVRTMGADHVVNSRSLSFADDIMALTGGKGVDIVLNSLAGEAITKGLQILKPFGRFLEIGKRDLYANNRIGLRPFRQNLSYFGIDADTLLVERPVLAKRMFDEVAAALASGELRALPHQAIPVSRAAEAFRAMQQSRHVGKLVVTLAAESDPSLAVVPRTQGLLKPDATYLVTGGLSGFGLATAHWLVEQGARSLALLGRRGEATDEAREGVARLRAAGATVQPFAADAADPDRIAAVLAEIRATMPPLRGVVHAAATIEDAPLMNVDRALMHRVMGGKMIGAWNLHRLTAEDELDLFVLYSSSSAVIGNPGQGCYVAANMFLDQLAQWRRAHGLAALSVGWGAIKDAGFLTRNAAVEGMLAQRAGMEATPAREALDELGRLLAAGATRVAAAQFNLMRLGQSLAGARKPRFLDMLPEGLSMAVEGAGSFASALEALGEEERRALLLTRVTEHVGRVVGSGTGQLDESKKLADLGLDSLMAVELAEALEQDLGRPVSVMQMIQAESIGGVTDSLMRGFRTSAAPAPVDVAAAQPELAAA